MTNDTNASRQIAAFAHEIRNPLALIRANLQYVELTDKKRKSKKNYEIIYREIDRISEILNICIDSSLGKRLELKSFKVSSLVYEIEQIFKHTLEFSNIKLSILIKDDMELVADYDKLKQVLINVIQNARESIDASKNRGDGHIELATCKEGAYIKIAVTDNGIGISDEELSMVGTPFFTKKENGCGLGISISKEIIECHKGSICITGAENIGASVLIKLPCR